MKSCYVVKFPENCRNITVLYSDKCDLDFTFACLFLIILSEINPMQFLPISSLPKRGNKMWTFQNSFCFFVCFFFLTHHVDVLAFSTWKWNVWLIPCPLFIVIATVLWPWPSMALMALYLDLDQTPALLSPITNGKYTLRAFNVNCYWHCGLCYGLDYCNLKAYNLIHRYVPCQNSPAVPSWPWCTGLY